MIHSTGQGSQRICGSPDDGAWAIRRNAACRWYHGLDAPYRRGDPKLALKLNGRLSWRLRRHEVGPPKPSRERHVTRLHDRASCERCILLTGAAAQHNRRAGSKTVWLADEPALLTREALRPAGRLQVASTSVIIGEDALLRKYRPTPSSGRAARMAWFRVSPIAE
jgi:hypothetical protein